MHAIGGARKSDRKRKPTHVESEEADQEPAKKKAEAAHSPKKDNKTGGAKKNRPKIPGGYNTQAKKNAAATETLINALSNLDSDTPQLGAALALAQEQLRGNGEIRHAISL